MSIDASIPLRAGMAGQINLADLFAQQDAQKARQQDMDMRREQFDWQKQLHADAMDEKKRAAIKAGLEDMAAAVQWADSPEKWAQVQQHYGQYDPQLASVPFEQREQALIHLGQMGEYLKANQEKFQSVEAGGSLIGITPNGQSRVVIGPNDGSHAMGDPMGGAGLARPQSKAEVDALPPGTQYIAPDGSTRRKGGGAQVGTGNFPPR